MVKEEVIKNKEREPRKKKQDRTGHKYSDQDFYNMSREEQLNYAKELRFKTPEEYDELKLFQFSKTKFWGMCQKLGFTDSVIDLNAKNISIANCKSSDEFVIRIDRNQDRDLLEKKYRLQKSTCERLDKALDGLSNVDKSIAIDAIVIFALDEIERLKEQDSFKVIYPAIEEKRLI